MKISKTYEEETQIVVCLSVVIFCTCCLLIFEVYQPIIILKLKAGQIVHLFIREP